MVIGDLLWDYFDQKKVIKKSSEEFVRLYKLFELHLKSSPENFKKIINDEEDFHINQMLTSYYLIAYVSKTKHNRKLSFQSVFQKEEFFLQDILISNKDIRKVFTTEYQIILNAIESITTMKKQDIKFMIDNMHEIVAKKQRQENIEDKSDDTGLADFGLIATVLERDLRELEDSSENDIDEVLKKLISHHSWG